LLIDNLKTVYRFEGSKHQISKPNSVYDHIQGLESIIKELCKDQPDICADLLTVAYLHDAGEIFGELSVLDCVLDKNLGYDKEDIEYQLFIHAMEILQTEGKNGVVSILAKRLPITQALRYKDFNRLETLISEGSDRVKVSKEVKALYLRATSNDNLLYKLFKPIDLIEGCMYYTANAKDPKKVPVEFVDRYLKYYLSEMGKLNEYKFLDVNINMIKFRIINLMVATLAEYQKLMGI
jgi:5'-deoxynucleotidase YfbR-like HD superfamily hydrolase